MDHTALVRRLDRRRDLDTDRQRLAVRQRSARKPVGERFALHELEYQVRQAALVLEA